MKYLMTAAMLWLGFTQIASAQQKMNMDDTSKHHHMMMKDTAKTNKMKMPEDDMTGMDMGDMQMSSAMSKNLPMERNGSGTSWLPDASPMYAVMLHDGKWMYMLHGSVWFRYTKQDVFDKGSRGGQKFDAPNWFMGMAQRPVGEKGLISFHLMTSLDPITESGGGYPLLFQTGESYKGIPLVDKQHPHDLIAELAANYTYALSKKADVNLYVGYPGEPAIGPAVFMHRPSAMSNPDAPISHHWSDATHITYGVATVGFRYGDFKLEGSVFNGREPDENRYGFDKMRFDSWATRLNYNPSENWALQVSHAYVKSPEALSPDENINRTTASAIYSLPFGNDRTFNASAVWGLNKIAGQQGDNSLLLEGDIRIKKLALYTRFEFVQKTTEELNLNRIIYGDDTIFPVNAVSVGINYDLLKLGPLNIAAGGQVSYYVVDNKLKSLYGAVPVGGEVFLRVYPRL